MIKPLLLASLILVYAGAPGIDSSVYLWNPIADILGKIAEAFANAVGYIANALWNAFASALETIAKAIVRLMVANPVPSLGDWSEPRIVEWYEIPVPEMMGLYSKARLVAYATLPIALAIGGLALALEGWIVSEGEGMAIVKRSLWTVVMIELAPVVYSYTIHYLAAATHYMASLEALSFFAGVGGLALGLIGLILAPIILLFLLGIALAGALRILLIASLMGLLPFLLVLSLIPRIGRIANGLIDLMLSLILIQPVTASVISLAGGIAGGIALEGVQGFIVRLAIVLGSLVVPIIAPQLLGGGGILGVAQGFTRHLGGAVAGARAGRSEKSSGDDQQKQEQTQEQSRYVEERREPSVSERYRYTPSPYI